MVHCVDPQHAAQAPSPACPRCGSHRTEVAGRSGDGRAVTVRCNNCDERAAVLIDRRAIDTDNMTEEVEAIRAVGRALAQLPDAAARVRVMRWAAERFQIETTVAAVAVASASPVTTATVKPPDPTLSMDGVTELFPAPADPNRVKALAATSLTLTAEPVAALAPHVEEIPPVQETPQAGSMLHSFVSDFQRLANDCQSVFAAPVTARR